MRNEATGKYCHRDGTRVEFNEAFTTTNISDPLGHIARALYSLLGSSEVEYS
jgi:hypothetical protein